MTKHTPGPWHVVEGKLTKSALEVHANSRAICELWRRGNAKTELANARLMAAAPDLLRVLVQLEQACADEGVQGMDSLLAAARAAIATATGEAPC